MITLFLATTLTQTGTVSCELRATRLLNAAPELSRCLGEQVRIAHELRNDLLTMSVHNVAAQEVKSRLAATLNATWTKTEQGLLLQQSSEQRQTEIDEVRKGVKERAESAIKLLQKKVSQATPFDAAAATSLYAQLKSWVESGSKGPMPIQDRSVGPNNQFTSGILARIRPEMLTNLSQSQRVIVYSNAPTRAELQLPFAVDDLARDLERGNQAWMDVTGGTGHVTTSKGLHNFYGLGFDQSRYMPREEKASRSVSLVLLTLSTAETAPDIRASVSAYDSTGDELSNSEVTLTPFWVDYVWNPAPKPERKTKFAWSPEAKEYIDWFKASPVNRPLMSPRLHDRIFNPEKFDPEQDTTFEVAKYAANVRNFIAYNVGGWKAPTETDELIADKTLVVKETQGWLTITPAQRFEARRLRVDPELLGPMIRVAENQDSMSLDEAADFAFRLPPNRDEAQQYESRINMVRPHPIATPNDFQLLRVYGSLSKQHRAELAAGKPLSVQQMGAATQRELYRLVFEAPNAYIPWKANSIYLRGGTEAENKLKMDQFRKYNSALFRRATRAFPSGFTQNHILQGNLPTTSERFLIFNPKWNSTSITDAKGLGHRLGVLQSPGPYPDSGMNAIDPQRIGLLTQNSQKLSLMSEDGRAIDYFLRQWKSDVRGYFKLEELPKEVRARIQEGTEDWLKQQAEMQKYRSGGTPPPPPL